MFDSRISQYREAAVAMRNGEFPIDVPVVPEDEIGALGEALLDLGKSPHLSK